MGLPYETKIMFPLCVFGLLLLGAIATAVTYSKILPETITNSNVTTRDQAILIYCLIVFLPGSGLCLLALLIPKIPIQYINIPYKQKFLDGNF